VANPTIALRLRYTGGIPMTEAAAAAVADVEHNTPPKLVLQQDPLLFRHQPRYWFVNTEMDL